MIASSAGIRVIAVRMAISTTTAAEYPSALTSGIWATASETSAMTTVPPANTTAPPAVATARAADSSTE
jgi:hypothetical protein